MGARRRGREAALQMLYQMEASGVSAEEAIRLFWGSFPPNPGEAAAALDGSDETIDPAERDGAEFANAIVRGFASERARIDDLIRHVSQHWRLERMTRVDRNVLRLGTWELVACDDIPRKVTLNESIELAKRFGTETSASFVNGVLDRIASDLKKE
ncbi:MAG: transcription antitermination factor NusB [Sandaracinaceae bacterium]|nr:transcription antitermination factor NusB [Sandaracinaceae bacterium]